MKTLARGIVEKHFRAELKPELQFGHNSADQLQIVASTVKGLILDSVFLRGRELDVNVSSSFCACLLADIPIRAAPITSPIQRYSIFASNFITTAKQILLRIYSLITSEGFRLHVLPWFALVYVLSLLFCFKPLTPNNRSLTVSTNGRQVRG